MSFPRYLPDQPALRCANCAAAICLASQVVSKGFTGRHGRAYLVADSRAAHPGVSALANTAVHRPVPRQLVTGAHTVSDISCCFCHVVLGWKYLAAEDEAQRYKVGKFIVEANRVSLSSGDTTKEVDKDEKDKKEAQVEFDSQDEDECEDLFAGVWTPALAAKRRRRRQRA